MKKAKLSVKTLSLLSLIFTITGYLNMFYYADSNSVSLLKPNFISILFLLFAIAPSVLLLIYFSKYRDKLKSRILIPLIFGLSFFRFSSVYYIICYTNHYKIYYRIYNEIYYANYNKIYYAINIIFVVFSVLTVLTLLKGTKGKILTIAPIVGIIFEVYNTIKNTETVIEEIRSLYILNIIPYLFKNIGMIILYIALIYFVKNHLSSELSTLRVIKPVLKESANPEDTLKKLKSEFESGIIGEEEYKAKKLEIISKL